MAIVKEKVKEYQNGSFVRSYSQINIPASVAKSVGDGLDTIGDVYSKVTLDKQNKIEATYRKLKETIEFLYQFKDLNSDYKKNIDFVKDRVDNTFDKYYESSSNGDIKFNLSYGKVFLVVAIIGFIISLFLKEAHHYLYLVVICFALMQFYVFMIYVPSTLRNARIDFETVEGYFKKLNLFTLANEFTIVLNHFNLDEQKGRVYNNEISKEEYEKNIVDSLQKVIDNNFIFEKFYQINTDKKEEIVSNRKTFKSPMLKLYLTSFLLSVVLSIIVVFIVELSTGGNLDNYSHYFEVVNRMIPFIFIHLIIAFGISIVIFPIRFFIQKRKLKKQAIQ